MFRENRAMGAGGLTFMAYHVVLMTSTSSTVHHKLLRTECPMYNGGARGIGIRFEFLIQIAHILTQQNAELFSTFGANPIHVNRERVCTQTEN